MHIGIEAGPVQLVLKSITKLIHSTTQRLAHIDGRNVG